MVGESQQQSNQNQLVNLVRECVHSEIELQCSGREGNASLSVWTRDLIAVLQDQSAEMLRICYLLWLAVLAVHNLFFKQYKTSAGVSGSYSVDHQTTVVTSTNRPATSQHPWYLKKGKQKKLQQEFYPNPVTSLRITQRSRQLNFRAFD